MKFLLHMNMPSGANDGTHQIILDVPEVSTLDALHARIVEGMNLLVGQHLVYDRDRDGRRVWKSRGPLIVNVDHVGKIAVYFEGEHETR